MSTMVKFQLSNPWKGQRNYGGTKMCLPFTDPKRKGNLSQYSLKIKEKRTTTSWSYYRKKIKSKFKLVSETQE